jgi:hypothetical protein
MDSTHKEPKCSLQNMFHSFAQGRYLYHNPKEFLWMCRLTDTPACENAVHKIEQQLGNEHDLDFRDLLVGE